MISSSASKRALDGCSRRVSPQYAAQNFTRPAAPRLLQRGGRVRGLVILQSAKAAELLQRANERYTSKDLMAAAKLYEDALNEDGATTRQKQAALYGSTAVHASFGDIELAQITLREGIRFGLDFEQALSDPELPDLITSPQMLIQLKRFNSSAQQQAASRVATRVAAMRQRMGGSGGGGGAGGPGNLLNQDLGSVLGTPTSDTAEIDTSVIGVLRRVLVLLIALTVLGVGLFYLGLETILQVN